jgi:hypothetical protein
MKKITILLALTIGVSAWAQCHKTPSNSSVIATFSGGFAKTMSAELSLKANRFILGAGAGIMVDNQIQSENNIQYTRNDNALFVNLGYQQDKVFFGARIGQRTIVHVTSVVNGVKEELQDESKLLVGALIGYSVTPRIRFNLGYDTFSKVNIGVALGL